MHAHQVEIEALVWDRKIRNYSYVCSLAYSYTCAVSIHIVECTNIL